MTTPAARKKGYYQGDIGDDYSFPSVSNILKPIEAVVCYHHRAEWDISANRGTMIHGFNEAWITGKAVDCPPDCTGYLDGLEAFWTAYQPETIWAERTVIYQHETLGYAGTPDWVAVIDGETWLLDIKTGKVREENAMQLAAYANATHIGVYDGFGLLTGFEPMTPIERCGIAHINADGTFALIPVDVTEQHEAFLNLRRFYDVRPTKALFGKPLAPKVKAAI